MSIFNCLISATALVMSVLNFILCNESYRFVPVSYTGFIIAFAVVNALYAFISVKCRKKAGKASRIAALLMPVIMIIFAISLFKLLETDGIYSEKSAICAVLLMPVELIASLVVFFSHAKREWAKIAVGITAGFIMGIYAVVCALYLFSVWFGSVEMTRSVVSPDEAYTVEVITHDEGALGGSTMVCLRKINDDVFVGLGTLKKRHHILECGDWGEEYNIEWKDNEYVTINSREYYVPYS